VCLLCSSCQTQKAFTSSQFQDIALGQDISDVQMQYGRPYEVRALSKDGKQEYIYMERIPLSGSRELFREYTLIISHNKVVEKKVREMASPAFEFHSQ
jgi:hypothetical protein